jgi:type II secretory pathway component PulC
MTSTRTHKNRAHILLTGAAALALTAVLAFPSRSIESLSLKGIDTSDVPLAIIGLENSEDEVYGVGETIPGIGKIIKIGTKAVLIQEFKSTELKLLLFNGKASQTLSPIREHREVHNVQSSPIPYYRKHNQTVITPELATAILPSPETTSFEKKGDNVISIKYPRDMLVVDYPTAIYLNNEGEDLFSDSNKVGVGRDATPYTENGTPLGVELGDCDKNTLLGGYGFKKGSVITEINEQPVHSPEDIMRVLKESAHNATEVRFTYMSTKRDGYFEGRMIIQNKNNAAKNV